MDERRKLAHVITLPSVEAAPQAVSTLDSFDLEEYANQCILFYELNKNSTAEYMESRPEANTDFHRYDIARLQHKPILYSLATAHRYRTKSLRLTTGRLQAFTHNESQNVRIDGLCEKRSAQGDIPVPGPALCGGDEKGDMRELDAGGPRAFVTADAAGGNHVRDQGPHIGRAAKAYESVVAGQDGNHIAFPRQCCTSRCPDGRLVLCDDDKRTFPFARSVLRNEPNIRRDVGHARTSPMGRRVSHGRPT